ncbi:MAG: hypothetical protein EPN36_14500 [Rhodanobacteraceae bacterium]|nr:MAG: hypothetical protein EPN36_14500 [Rhodanobacteraceae bacterium]
MTITLAGINAARRTNAIRCLCLSVVTAVVLVLAIAALSYDSITPVATADVGAITSITSAGDTTFITTARGRIGIRGPVAAKAGQALELRQFPTGNTYLCMEASCAATMNVLWPMTPTGATVFPVAFMALIVVLSTFTLICLLVLSYTKFR